MIILGACARGRAAQVEAEQGHAPPTPPPAPNPADADDARPLRASATHSELAKHCLALQAGCGRSEYMLMMLADSSTGGTETRHSLGNGFESSERPPGEVRPMKQGRRHCRSRLLLKQSLPVTPRVSLELLGFGRFGGFGVRAYGLIVSWFGCAGPLLGEPSTTRPGLQFYHNQGGRE